jgi:Domain of unknown function DUF29
MLLQNSYQELINNYNLYKEDYYLWIKTTVKQLQEKNLDLVDWTNLIEEIDSLGKQQQQELENRLIVLIEHLLKLAYWEEEKAYNQRGWQGTIIEQRKQIFRLLKKNPSLKPYLLEIFPECYTDARDIAIAKTGLSQEIFPSTPTFTIEQSVDEKWFIQSEL